MPQPTTHAGFNDLHLRRALKLCTETIASIERHIPKDSANDTDLHQAIDMVMRAQMIIGRRVDLDAPR